MNTIDKCYPALLFIMSYKLVLAFDNVDAQGGSYVGVCVLP